MGNRLCKKKNMDTVDHSETKENTFDRLITRFHLRSKSWTSDSQLSKQLTRSSKTRSGNILSKSTDYVNAALEVPQSETKVHITNTKKEPIFNLDNNVTPIAPPRKRRSIKENIEAVAKSGLQILQPKKPVEEPLCIKKTINYDCPCDKIRSKHNHHDHKKIQENNAINKREHTQDKLSTKIRQKENKRKKNLSVVSLPNYSELKFSLADFDDENKRSSDEKSIKSSHISLPFEHKSNSSKGYMVRCRSFGSILPQQLLDKLKPASNKITNIESDDSFGPLEDWNLELIEHYNPRDASLPRPRKSIASTEKILADIESSIIKEQLTLAESSRPTESLSQGSFENVECRDCRNTSSEEIPNKPDGSIGKDIVCNLTQPGNQLKLIEQLIENKTTKENLSLHKQDSNKLIAEHPKQSLNRDIIIVEDFIEAEKLSTSQLTSAMLI